MFQYLCLFFFLPVIYGSLTCQEKTKLLLKLALTRATITAERTQILDEENRYRLVATAMKMAGNYSEPLDSRKKKISKLIDVFLEDIDEEDRTPVTTSLFLDNALFLEPLVLCYQLDSSFMPELFTTGIRLFNLPSVTQHIKEIYFKELLDRRSSNEVYCARPMSLGELALKMNKRIRQIRTWFNHLPVPVSLRRRVDYVARAVRVLILKPNDGLLTRNLTLMRMHDERLALDETGFPPNVFLLTWLDARKFLRCENISSPDFLANILNLTFSLEFEENEAHQDALLLELAGNGKGAEEFRNRSQILQSAVNLMDNVTHDPLISSVFPNSNDLQGFIFAVCNISGDYKLSESMRLELYDQFKGAYRQMIIGKKRFFVTELPDIFDYILGHFGLIGPISAQKMFALQFYNKYQDGSLTNKKDLIWKLLIELVEEQMIEFSS